MQNLSREWRVLCFEACGFRDSFFETWSSRFIFWELRLAGLEIQCILFLWTSLFLTRMQNLSKRMKGFEACGFRDSFFESWSAGFEIHFLRLGARDSIHSYGSIFCDRPPPKGDQFFFRGCWRGKEWPSLKITWRKIGRFKVGCNERF